MGPFGQRKVNEKVDAFYLQRSEKCWDDTIEPGSSDRQRCAQIEISNQAFGWTQEYSDIVCQL